MDLLTVERSGDAYEVVLQSKKDASEKQTYEMHLVNIGGIRFADILPTGGILGHMFLKVRVGEGELRIAFFDSAWLRERRCCATGSYRGPQGGVRSQEEAPPLYSNR